MSSELQIELKHEKLINMLVQGHLMLGSPPKDASEVILDLLFFIFRPTATTLILFYMDNFIRTVSLRFAQKLRTI